MSADDLSSIPTWPEDDFMAESINRGDLALMDFGSALGFLKSGGCVSRADWNGAGQFLTLQQPDWGSHMTLPYIFITTVRGDRVPWLASQTDLLRNDWYIVDTAIDNVKGCGEPA